MINSYAEIMDAGLWTKNGEAVPLKGVLVNADIIGKSSKVIVTQQFKNEGRRAIEAVYKFPLPENAAISGFRILSKGKVIRGVVEEREKAFETYDKALEKGDGAVLLDQERPNIFTLSVGNVNPGTEVSVEIEYISILDFKNNILSFYLPTTISPRYVPESMPDRGGISVGRLIHPEYAAAVPYGLNIKVNVLKTAGISSISSPSHKVKTNMGKESYMVELTGEAAGMDRDFVVDIEYRQGFKSEAFYLRGKDESISVGIGDGGNVGGGKGSGREEAGGKGEGFLQIDFTPDLKGLASDVGGDKEALAPANDIVFVLDCSGSMSGSSMDQAKKALEILIKALKPEQRFNIYRFGSTFDKFSNAGEISGENYLSSALDFLGKTDAGFGGTEILGPLEDIVSGGAMGEDFGCAEGKDSVSQNGKRIKNIVLITDGEVGNEQEVINLVRENKDRFRVFTVGIGFGPNEYFVKEMALLTGGDYIMVHPEERIDLKVISLFKNLNMGALEDLTIEARSGNRIIAIEQAPNLLAAFDRNNYSIFARVSGAVGSAGGTDVAGGGVGGTVKISGADGGVGGIGGMLSDTAVDNVVIKGLYNGRAVSWNINVLNSNNNVFGGDSDGKAAGSFIAKLWAKEKIRELEAGYIQAKGSQQAERKVISNDSLIVELSKKYGVVSSKTSFVSVEERSAEDKTKGEVELKKIPTLVTYGWHGIGAGEGQVCNNLRIDSSIPFLASAPSPGIAQRISYDRSSSPTDAETFYCAKEMLHSANEDSDNAVAYKKYSKSHEILRKTTRNFSDKSSTLPKGIYKRAYTADKDIEEVTKENVLIEILSCQMPGGGFEINIGLGNLLNINTQEIERLAQLVGLRQSDMDLTGKIRLVSTALLLEILKVNFKDRSDSWESIVEKSQDWLSDIVKKSNPSVEGKPLMDFIKDYVEKI